MTEQEKFELNQWLWLNVFGWVKFREEEYPYRSGYALGSDEGEKCREYDMPNYFEPANAMELLKMCLDYGAKPDLYKGVKENGDYGYCMYTSEHYVDSPSLELTICLFAKKLFTKDNP